MRATAKEHVPNVMKHKSANGERLEKEQEVDEEKENEWLQPKNCMSKKHVCETCGKKEDKDNNNNKHVALSDDK